jgi:integrase/recombinase XerC
MSRRSGRGSGSPTTRRCGSPSGAAGVKPAEINARFTAYRDALGLPRALTVHSERHAYVTHLTENGADRRFIQQQVGHECDSSTAVYTHVSDDFMNTALSRALAPAFAGA